MVQTFQLITLLALIVTTFATSSSLTARVVSPQNCEEGRGCEPGEVCTKQQVVCVNAPCNPVYTCVSKADKNQPNPCMATTCPMDYSCVPGKYRGPPNKNLLLPICVLPPCWLKECSLDKTCVMKPDSKGNQKAVCVSLSSCKPVPTRTCAHLRCHTCKMINCAPQCIPSV